MVNAKDGMVLATINSSGPIDLFEIQDRKGVALCRGQAGTSNHMLAPLLHAVQMHRELVSRLSEGEVQPSNPSNARQRAR